jgi:hypothetical protein
MIPFFPVALVPATRHPRRAIRGGPIPSHPPSSRSYEMTACVTISTPRTPAKRDTVIDVSLRSTLINKTILAILYVHDTRRP